MAADVAGHTFSIGRPRLHFASGGQLYGRAGDDVDLGTWAIEDGRVCRRWTTWDRGLRRCYVIARDRDGYVFDIPERFTRFAARRAPGGLEP